MKKLIIKRLSYWDLEIDGKLIYTYASLAKLFPEGKEVEVCISKNKLKNSRRWIADYYQGYTSTIISSGKKEAQVCIAVFKRKTGINLKTTKVFYARITKLK